MPPNHHGGGQSFSSFDVIKSAIKCGLVCALVALILNFLVVFAGLVVKISLPNYMGSMSDIFNTSSSKIKVLSAISIAPGLETLIFTLMHFSTSISEFTEGRKKLLFIFIMGFLGWLLHGASWISISRGVSFAILASFYATWHDRLGLKAAFFGTALAHAVWNLSAFLAIAAMFALRH
ncbi:MULTISPECIES: hypothetical protein [unclassified Sphingomonas]|uniref:hypothetical protein n=1 Tax=unclassified Sphingomonas TaxID=196159 RepID=UPI0035A83FC4